MEEVSINRHNLVFINVTTLQNLHMEMDVDEDNDGTQHPRRVDDYGIEVDFEALDDDEREVSRSSDGCTIYSRYSLPGWVC